jgi:tRNA(Arg) A34 adenosine deaminase TadA
MHCVVLSATQIPLGQRWFLSGGHVFANGHNAAFDLQDPSAHLTLAERGQGLITGHWT